MVSKDHKNQPAHKPPHVEATPTIEKTMPVGKIEPAERNLQRQLDWVGRTDTKFSVVLGINTGILGILASVAPPFHLWTWYMIASTSAFVTCIALSYAFLYYGMYPQTRGPSGSLLFFGSIANLATAEFQDRFLRQTTEEYLNDVLEQTHRNAVIVNCKFSRLKWAYRMLFIAVIFWAPSLYFFKSLVIP